MENNKFLYTSENLENAYRNTMMNGVPKGLYTGLNSLDDLFRLDRGKLVVVTGVPNMGKSEFVDYLCVQYNKQYGMRTVYFSPENQPIALHIGKLFRKFEGRKDCKEDVMNERSIAVRRYIYENFFFFIFTFSSNYTNSPNKIARCAAYTAHLCGYYLRLNPRDNPRNS